MAIFKKGDNWYIDYYVKGHRKRKKIGPSKKLALQVEKDVLIKIAKGEYLGIYDDKKVCFDNFGKQYLDYSKANKAWSTYIKRDCTNINHLTSFFKNKYLSEITPQSIEKYKAKRLEKVAPATVNRELACLKHMFTKANDWELIKTNPVRSVKLLKEPPGRLRYLKSEEVGALLDECAPHIRSIVITALNTGMRKAEILNLKWADVDLNNRKLAVIKTKSNETRVIPINRTLHQELLDLSNQVKMEYVFCNSDGKPYGDIKTGFSGALRRAGIKDFRFHDLRHTFGSHMVMQGVSLRTVQQVLGHKDIRMTMRYSHLSPEYVQEAMERLDDVWTLYGHQSQNRENKGSTKSLIIN